MRNLKTQPTRINTSQLRYAWVQTSQYRHGYGLDQCSRSQSACMCAVESFSVIAFHVTCTYLRVQHFPPLLTGFVMGRRRKHRTHLKGVAETNSAAGSVPKSFIIKHGQVGSSVTQLVRDFRRVMEPNTAARLRVRLRPSMFSCLKTSATTCVFVFFPGAIAEQAQGLSDHGTRASGDAPARVHLDAYRTVAAHRQIASRPNAELPYRTVQPREGCPAYIQKSQERRAGIPHPTSRTFLFPFHRL